MKANEFLNLMKSLITQYGENIEVKCLVNDGTGEGMFSNCNIEYRHDTIRGKFYLIELDSNVDTI
jgi:hypothetical protein